MLFSSAIFLFFFLPILLLGYFIAPKKLKNIVLLIASLAFYSFGEKELVLLILASVLIDYSSGQIIERGWRKVGLYFSIISNLGILFYFKYIGFVYENYYTFLDLFHLENEVYRTIPEVALPLGISFFTFQTMSYTIDVYRGNVKASRNIIDFATYVTMFPQLVAGPIVRYKDIYKQLQKRTVTRVKFAEGVERFIIGLAKK
jgi:alginate O-acetyltransferase complex protein AlgI